MAESLDVRRMAREQEERMTANIDFGFKAAKPFVQFQTSIMRLFAENMEQAARKSFEAIGNIAAALKT
jgi:outer membrane lipopolysaccharide assembly protein LptE/RlpB